MIGKLIKYELRSVLRKFFPLWAGLAALGLLNGFTIRHVLASDRFEGLASFLLGARWENGHPLTTSGVGTTMSFLTLALVETFHAFNMRNQRKSIFTLKHQNLWLWGSTALSLVLTYGVVLIPFLQQAFGFVALTAGQVLTASALALAIIPIIELVKLIQRSIQK